MDDNIPAAHPNLTDEVNSNIIQSEVMGGVWLKDLAVGKSLLVVTRNTRYVIEKRCDSLYITGSPRWCSTFTKCHITGSTWGGSALKAGFIGRGMHMEFITEASGLLTTSEIQELTEL